MSVAPSPVPPPTAPPPQIQLTTSATYQLPENRSALYPFGRVDLKPKNKNTKNIVENTKTTTSSAPCKTTSPEEGEKEEWRQEFECPVCLEEMSPPTRIHQCQEGHVLCGRCADNPSITCCPSCRGEMSGRAVAMEKLARTLYRM